MKPVIDDYPVKNTPGTSTNYRKAFAILFFAFLLTFFAVLYTKHLIEIQSKKEFALVCNEIKVKIDTRLHTHALLLRSSSSFYSASENVSKSKWKVFIEKSLLNKNLPGIQGVGFSLIIPKNKLSGHIQQIQQEGFPGYAINPAGDRDIYTSIIFLEPFSGRNLRAFGYDMYSESVRRNAMEKSRDLDLAALSGKVRLVQESGQDEQAGTLMFVSVYRNGMPANTVEERRAAIVGWVYSPFRMDDLMNGTLGRWDTEENNRIRLQIFDGDRISEASLLFDSKRKDGVYRGNLSNHRLLIPIKFNDKIWTLLFTPAKERSFYFQSEVILVLFSGIVISLLLFSLTLSLYNTRTRAMAIAGQLTLQLEKRDKFLREEQLKLQLANKIAHLGSWELDLSSHQVVFSDEIFVIFGINRDQINGNLHSLVETSVHPDDRALVKQTSMHESRTGIGQTLEYRIVRPGGEVRWIRAIGEFVYDEGKIVKLFVTNQDITASKLADEAINKLNETLEERIAERTRQLKASNEELAYHLSEIEQLTYIAAHDLQEPLLTLTNFTDLLKEEYTGKLEENGNEYIGFISRSAGRMKELVRGMLDYSLLGKEAELALVDCNTLIGEVRADLAACIGACNASISVQLLPTINCYPTEMRLLFQNLVNNAIKFRRAEVLPAIKISVEPFETGWKFTIADNGIGIEKKNLEKVFAIFKRLHNRSTYEGTGIGLAHCKKIVELHRGKIRVESVPEKGSRFIFTIPAL